MFSPRARGCSDALIDGWISARVFPACAGMFRQHRSIGRPAWRFPRVRGDVPQARNARIDYIWFSPRARGCSLIHPRFKMRCDVFPACAGMFLTASLKHTRHSSFPRVRGDVPSCVQKTISRTRFSPRARGCSSWFLFRRTRWAVFPACAGMFLTAISTSVASGCFPRVRGDVPSIPSSSSSRMLFSPRARGCSGEISALAKRARVFPACAGMFLFPPPRHHHHPGFPRVRGDVPILQGVADVVAEFSPRARGCSDYKCSLPVLGTVFPACAGMFLPQFFGADWREGFPRVRGDVPLNKLTQLRLAQFSPRARGCS